MKVTVVGPNLPREAKATFEVHADGCAHVTLSNSAQQTVVRRGWGRCDGFTLVVESKLDVESFVYDFAPDEHEDYTLGDWQSEFHFAPCCAKALPDGEAS